MLSMSEMIRDPCGKDSGRYLNGNQASEVMTIVILLHRSLNRLDMDLHRSLLCGQ